MHGFGALVKDLKTRLDVDTHMRIGLCSTLYYDILEFRMAPGWCEILSKLLRFGVLPVDVPLCWSRC